MPMYFAIAILSVRKQQFQQQHPEKFSSEKMFQWRSDEELIVQFDNIFQLNTLVVEDGKSSHRSLCEMVERVIAIAISYMYVSLQSYIFAASVVLFCRRFLLCLSHGFED
jgi:hypothetical protein